jgi:hypothetical protein
MDWCCRRRVYRGRLNRQISIFEENMYDPLSFDESMLPASIVPDVTVENVTTLFKNDAWRLYEDEISKKDLEV